MNLRGDKLRAINTQLYRFACKGCSQFTHHIQGRAFSLNPYGRLHGCRSWVSIQRHLGKAYFEHNPRYCLDLPLSYEVLVRTRVVSITRQNQASTWESYAVVTKMIGKACEVSTINQMEQEIFHIRKSQLPSLEHTRMLGELNPIEEYQKRGHPVEELKPVQINEL